MVHLFVNRGRHGSTGHMVSSLIGDVHTDSALAGGKALEHHGERDSVLSSGQGTGARSKGVTGIAVGQRPSPLKSVVGNGDNGEQVLHRARGLDDDICGKLVTGGPLAGQGIALRNVQASGTGQARTSVKGDVDGSDTSH